MGGTLSPRPDLRALRVAQVAGIVGIASAIAGLALWSALPTLGSRMLGIGGVDHSGTVLVRNHLVERQAPKVYVGAG